MSDVAILKTKRLELRPVSMIAIDHIALDLFPIFNDVESMRFMPTLPHQEPAETRDYLRGEINRPGAFYWNVHFPGRPDPVGSVQFLGETRLPGMGYIIRREFWGQGIATEACRAAIAFGFEQLGYDQIELWINTHNLASQRVAEKLGFHIKGRLPQKYPYERNHHMMLVYGMRAAEWFGQESKLEKARFFNLQPVLYVHDIVETVTFYQEKLGFGLDFLFGDPPNHAAVSRGDWSAAMVIIQLTLVPPDQVINPAGQLYIMVDTLIDQLFEHYQNNGVDIIREPQSYPWGMREFAIRDLDGHILRFGTHV